MVFRNGNRVVYRFRLILGGLVSVVGYMNGDKKRYKGRDRIRQTQEKKTLLQPKRWRVFVARLFVQQERQSVLVRDQHFVDSWWQQFLCRCSRFWQEKARRVPNRHDRGAETIFAVYCFSDTRRLVTKMLTMLVGWREHAERGVGI